MWSVWCGEHPLLRRIEKTAPSTLPTGLKLRGPNLGDSRNARAVEAWSFESVYVNSSSFQSSGCLLANVNLSPHESAPPCPAQPWPQLLHTEHPVLWDAGLRLGRLHTGLVHIQTMKRDLCYHRCKAEYESLACAGKGKFALGPHPSHTNSQTQMRGATCGLGRVHFTSLTLSPGPNPMYSCPKEAHGHSSIHLSTQSRRRPEAQPAKQSHAHARGWPIQACRGFGWVSSLPSPAQPAFIHARG